MELEQLSADIAAAGAGRPRAEEPEAGGPETGSLRLCLRVEPYQDGHGETAAGEAATALWRLSFWAEGAENPRVLLPAGLIWSYPGPDMEIHGLLYRNVQENFLLRLSKAAAVSREVAAAMEHPRPQDLLMDPKDLITFLSKSVPALRKLGVNVQMPTRWTREGRRAASIRIKTRGFANGMQDGGIDGMPRLGVDQLVAFEAKALLGDRELTREELMELASAKLPLVFFRGEWIEVDTKEIRQVLKFIKRHETAP